MHTEPDNHLSRVLAGWRAPEPPPGMATGVWARVDARPSSLMGRPWAFRTALGLTLALWMAAIALPARNPAPTASQSLTVALARAGGAR